MKNNNNTKYFIYLIIGIFIFSCTNEFDYGKSQNAVKTFDYNNIAQTTVDVTGNVITDNGANLSAKGICYGTTNTPTISDLKRVYNTVTLGVYTCTLDNLSPSTTYFARAYATNGYGTAYGSSIKFTTLAATVPIVSSTTTANLVTATTAKTGGTITNSGASKITSSGVCYSSTASVPTIADAKTNDGTAIGTFISSLTGLTVNTNYYIRAYATNSIGTAYGDVKSFSTTTATIPIGITTTSVSTIAQTTAYSGGNITNDGGSNITSRGVCWSNASSNPTIADPKTNNGTGVGAFSSSITYLSPGTTYYVKAYATNSVGTAYGNTVSLTTVAATLPKGITTNSLSSITQTTAIGGGNITTDGGATVTFRGVCWSNSTSSPTIYNSKTIDGTSTGAYSSSLTSLTSGTTYYVRAYATNSAGTAYGNTVSFTTPASTVPRGISTTSLSSISQNTAKSGGVITDDGGNTVTSRGVCWSSSTSSPTIYNSKTNDGTGEGSFSSSLTALVANTTYYLRAYATNSLGTAYGNTLTCTTLPDLSVGQSYQGGIIAYIFTSNDIGYIAGQTHGLIATKSNQSTGNQWGCSGTTISGTSTSLGTGLANTTAIIYGCSTVTIAATLCYNLSTGGYNDWYLPSYYELEKLYLNRNRIGGFSSTSYWSSSQSTSTTAYSLSFVNGNASASAKTNLLYVRAIRKF